jgi:leucyl aminopeptidase (aminopeptidase T)
VGNLPSGEAYMVPYEGERPGDPSRSDGILPVELDGEVVLYRVVENRAVEVLSSGPRSRAEGELLALEPAYGNLAELGLGVLAAWGIRAIGSTLLDEKLGLHIAFGRSDHFGGAVGPRDFRDADRVVHIDRVYVPECQPRIAVREVTLRSGDGASEVLMRDGLYLV